MATTYAAFPLVTAQAFTKRTITSSIAQGSAPVQPQTRRRVFTGVYAQVTLESPNNPNVGQIWPRGR